MRRFLSWLKWLSLVLIVLFVLLAAAIWGAAIGYWSIFLITALVISILLIGQWWIDKRARERRTRVSVSGKPDREA